MRASIRQVRNIFGNVWEVDVAGNLHYYHTFDTAMIFLKKTLTRAYKEAAAYSMARTLSSTGLSIAEGALVRKLNKSKCKGITPKQYGYLKGIHERQEREW